MQKTQNYIYDNGHRLLNDGIYSYTYGAPSCSCANRIETVTDVRGVTRYEYDYKGRVKKTIYPDGTIVESIYDDISRKKTVKLDGEVLFILNLDGEGRASGSNAIIEQVGGGNNVFSITRDNAGRIKEVIYPNEDRSVTEYDVEGRIVKHKNYYKTHLINKFEFTLDGEGNKMTEKTILGMRNYGYDDIYQLTSARYERNQEFTWVYDAAGNRIVSDEIGDSKTYVPNNLNQYDSVNGVSYSYDADGNLVSDGSKNYSWDVRNRLIQVINGNKTINYTYDHNDLRVEKEVDGRKIKYYYDGSLLLAEKDGNGRILKIYINDGEGIVGMIRYIYNASGIFSHYQRLYYLYDSLGSISVIASENGLPLQNYTYSPYGSTMNVDYDPVNNLRFVGRYGGYKDDDTGLTYFWHRWYDEGDGRWVSRDMEDSCDFEYDAYSYTKNSPLNYLDTNGLWRYKKDKSVEPTSAETEKMIDCLQAKLECGLIVTGGGEKGKPHKGLGHREGRAVDFGTNSNPCLKYKDVNKVCQAAIECGFNFTDFENQGTPNEHYHFEKRSGPVNNKCKDKHKKDSCDIKPNLPTLGDL